MEYSPAKTSQIVTQILIQKIFYRIGSKKKSPQYITKKYITASIHIFHKKQKILCFPLKATARHLIRKKIPMLPNFQGKWHACKLY